MMYSLNEVTILPSSICTDINSRSEVNPYDENGKLPIFVSPMTCIINAYNFYNFKQSKVIPILPRGVTIEIANLTDWIAYSLDEFEKLMEYDMNDQKVLIDVANGHMGRIYNLVEKAKKKWPNVTIMVGNIAHPEMYRQCYLSGVDYIRVGIGGGNGCSTSVKTGIHMSLQYLLTEIKKIKEELRNSIYVESDLPDGDYFIKPVLPKVIADGGIDRIDKAIKCLALGADYVMMGKTFAQCGEACGKMINIDGKLFREYYGMASTKGQSDISGGVKKNPEGIITTVPILYNLEEYCNDFEAALRSAMSYTGAHNLEEFKTVQTGIQSLTEFKAYDK